MAENLRRIFPAATDDMIMAALLHDTMEDCEDVDEQYLLGLGYSQECVEMVRIVTKPKGDTRTYDEVIDDIILSGNKGAMLIKIADNMDNLRPDRVQTLRNIDPVKADRLEKRYQRSIEKLTKAVGLDVDVIRAMIADSVHPIRRRPSYADMPAEYFARSLSFAA